MTPLAAILTQHEAGVFTGIPAKEYHASAGVSRSHLSKLADSPFELWHSLANPGSDTQTGPQTMGSLVDHFIERGACDSLPDGYVVVPDVHMGSKEGRAIKAANVGATLVKTPMVETAQNCFESIQKHTRLAGMIGECQRQLSVYSDLLIEPTPGANGELSHLTPVTVTRRCRPDLVPPEKYLAGGYTMMMDLKTTSADLTSDRAWWFECRSWGYFLQAGWYLNVCRAAGLDRTLFGHVAVETHPPYRVRCYSLDPVEVEAGYQECLRLLAKLVDCHQKNDWSDDADIIRPLTSPYQN